MDFSEPRSRPDSATIEHLLDAPLGSVRQPKHRRLAHAICNRMRNEFKLQAERQFQAWLAERVAAASAPVPAPAATLQSATASPSSSA